MSAYIHRQSAPSTLSFGEHDSPEQQHWSEGPKSPNERNGGHALRAAALETPQATLMAWLAPESATKHRAMPVDYRLALQRVLDKQR
jgi:hypothetical protein